MSLIAKASLAACLIAGACLAQTIDDALRSKLANVHYPPLAEAARIQGDVHITVRGAMVTLISGHAVLAGFASESAKAFESIQDHPEIDLTYHFVIVDTMRSVPTTTTVKRGNAFERAILRVFGFKTKKVIHGHECESGTAPPSEMNVKGDTVEIWIYGRTLCLMTVSTTVVDSR